MPYKKQQETDDQKLEAEKRDFEKRYRNLMLMLISPASQQSGSRES